MKKIYFKQCKQCGANFTSTVMNKQYCTPCRESRTKILQKKYSRNYRKTHREYFKKYRREHADKFREGNRKYRVKNRELLNLNARIRYYDKCAARYYPET